MALEFTHARNVNHLGPLVMTASSTSDYLRLTIASDFSRYPGGRFREDGDYSGQEFRDDYLLPRLKAAASSGGQLIVFLDGVTGYPASFLEEAFGGIVREGHYSREELRKILSIQAGMLFDSYRLLTWEYIDQARKPK